MAVKTFWLDGIGAVSVYKRRGLKRLNLRIVGQKIKVTQPIWLPYASGIQFATNQKSWIDQQINKLPNLVLKNDMPIGKLHNLSFQTGQSLRSRLSSTKIIIYLPPNQSFSSPSAQLLAKNTIKRALKNEAALFLPDRLSLMARQYNFNYHEVKFKSLRSRWGSCTNHQDITLSIYLMTLPWEIIDYVLLHELVHTKQMHHGKSFWAAVATIMPDFKERRDQLKQLQPLVDPLR